MFKESQRGRIVLIGIPEGVQSSRHSAGQGFALRVGMGFPGPEGGQDFGRRGKTALQPDPEQFRQVPGVLLRIVDRPDGPVEGNDPNEDFEIVEHGSQRGFQ